MSLLFDRDQKLLSEKPVLIFLAAKPLTGTTTLPKTGVIFSRIGIVKGEF